MFMFDENYYAKLQQEEEAEQQAIALQEKDNPLAKALKAALDERIQKDGVDWYEKSKLRQIGCTTGEELVY